jgi:hypothetical protein
MRENDGEDKRNQGTLQYGNVTMKLPVQLIYASKNIKKSCLHHKNVQSNINLQ